MEKKFLKKLNIIKFLLVLNNIYPLLSECNRTYPILKDNLCVSTYCTEEQFQSGICIINEEITKTQWLTNIFKFEKTNGDISLILNKNGKLLLFSTGSKDNKQKIYFEFDSYDFTYKSYNITDNNEIINPQLYIMTFNMKKYIISIGIKNSFIRVIDDTRDLDEYLTLNPSSFLNDPNRIIEGIGYSCLYYNNEHFFYATITQKSDELSDYYLTFFDHTIENIYNMRNDLNFKLNYKVDIDLTKGNFVSCSTIDKKDGHATCFYLNKNNSYIITVVQNNKTDFIIQDQYIIGNPSNSNENNLYFLKVITLDDYIVLYSYFSGDEDNIPTFLMREISSSNFSLSYLYSDFPVIYLFDYEFNNNIKYNDLVGVSTNDFYFISTNNDKDIFIIAHIYIYKNSLEINQLIIRYYTIKLKEYYYFQILNGFKAINLIDNFLALAFDFCNYDLCQNSGNDINNAGFTIFSNFSYVKGTFIYYDFIEYALEYNRNYLLFNFTENIKIDNNIFGYFCYNVCVNDYDYAEMTEYYYGEELLDFYEQQYFPFEDIMKVKIIKYSEILDNMILYYEIIIQTPNEVSEYNKYCDKINDTLGDQNDNKSYIYNYKSSLGIYHYITINENLLTTCNNPNCTLCLEDNKDYCLVCGNDNYIVLEGDYKYGKLKLCNQTENKNTILTEVDSQINIQSTNINIESTNINIQTTNIDIETTNINIESTNINIPSTNIDIETTNINIESTNINIPSTNIDIETTNINIPSTNIFIESTILTNLISTEIFTNEKTETIIPSIVNTDLTTILNEKISNTIIEESIIDISSTNNIESLKTEGNIDNSYLITSDSEILNNHNISSTDFSDSIISENEVTQENIETQNKPIELSLEDLFGDKYKEITLSKEQITEIYKDLKDYINNNYNGENIIIKTENVKIQISTLDSQQDSELSNVNLGKCAEIIKEKYCKSENDSLLMLKFDITPENEKSTYVQYEVYEQMSKQFLELKECTGTNVIINSPIELNSYIESLYDHLSKYGYNLFNGNDSFYNDICAVYTTENGTDILLYDRRMDIYKSTLNISLCQEGCIFLSYNSETKKAECDCPIQTNEMNLDISSLHFDKNKMLDEFYETLKNSNFRVLKCYQLTYNIKVFIHNLGCIIMSILLLLFNILTIIYLFKNSRKINFFIQSVIKTKYSDSENSKTISSYKELKLFLKKNSDKKEQKMKIKRLTVKSNKTKKKKKKKKLRNSAILINKKGLSLEDNNQLKEKKKIKIHFLLKGKIENLYIKIKKINFLIMIHLK